MSVPTPEASALKRACENFLRDLQALPEEAFCKSFGLATRTVADIAYEVNLVNDHVGMVLRGEEPFAWPDERLLRAPAGFDTKKVVVGAFEESSRRIVLTAEGFSTEAMAAPFATEEGETTRAERCGFMTLHLWYHSGQLNFIQTLLGDDGWHWK